MIERSAKDLRWAGMMEQSQSGDRQQYEELLRELTTALRSYFSRHGQDEAQSEDLTQETLLAVHRARHTFLPGKSFQAWFYSIARNKLIDYARARKIKLDVTERDYEIDVDTMASSLEMSSPTVLADAIRILPLKQRMVLSLLRFSGCSVKSTATQLGITESDVKVTAHRVQKILRETLGI